MIDWFIGVAIWLLFAWFTYRIASMAGYKSVWWFIGGLIFPVITLLVAVFLLVRSEVKDEEGP